MDEKILVDSERAIELGLTSEFFEGDSYLWEDDDSIYISMIFAKNPGTGHFGNLVKNMLATGKWCKVPTPSNKMRAILEHYGFERTIENGDMGACEVYKKQSKEPVHE